MEDEIRSSVPADTQPAPPASDSESTSEPAEAGQGDPEGSQASAPAAPAWLEDLKDAEDYDEILRRVVKKVDRTNLTKDPVLSGIVGDIADKRARQLVEEQRRQEQEQARRERLKKAADEQDLVTLGEAMLENLTEEEKAEAARQERERLAGLGQEMFETYSQSGLSKFLGKQPKEVRDALVQGKTDYSDKGEWDEGFASWLEDVVSARVAHERKGWETTSKEALRRELLAELNGNPDEAPTISTGAAGSGALTEQEWQQNRSNASWRRANRQRIVEAVSTGRIRG